jgi:hypothetical protein
MLLDLRGLGLFPFLVFTAWPAAFAEQPEPTTPLVAQESIEPVPAFAGQRIGRPSGGLTNPGAFDPAFAVRGRLTVARSGHTTTLLPGGRLLVIGGSGGSGIHRTAELCDPVLGGCVPTGSLLAGRMSHTATLLRNGKVLVVGGRFVHPSFGETSLASAELYDPATGTFTSAAPLPFPRDSHTATLIEGGRVLIAGGVRREPEFLVQYVMSSTMVYDPATGQFTATGSLVVGRANHTATLFPGGRVLIAGGGVGAIGTEATASAEI